MSIWASRPNLVVLSGLTGSGKTDILYQLRQIGEQVIDLEMLARHRGSVFGGLGQEPQPEHNVFGDAVALAWHSTDPMRIVWIEDEGPFLGSVGVPIALQQLMAVAPAIELVATLERRRARLCEEFGNIPMHDLLGAIKRVGKRVGIERTRAALSALEAGKVEMAASPLMAYYDNAYVERARRVHREVITRMDPDEGANSVLLVARSWIASRKVHVASQT